MQIDRIIERALEEDLAAGDVTTEACVPLDARATAHAIARKDIIVCGAEVFARVFERVDASIVVERHLDDSVPAKPGAKMWTVRGPARAVLMGERTALNFVQRMCGIATLARKYVDALPPGSKTRITDTRKTTPSLRVLERYAVRTGGAHNHRDNLASAVLIKDNHIIAAGGIRPAIERCRARAPHTSRVECEVTSLAELDEALSAGADVVLLDNMSTDLITQAVKRVAGRALIEASGGVTLERIPELARTGVDAISVGALTHSPPSADIGLDFE